MRLWLAIKIFFQALFSGPRARQVAQLLAAPASAAQPPAATAPRVTAQSAATPAAEFNPQPPAKPSRSDALTLLSALQREARFVDFVKETLDGYSDAQVGAAARDVHRDCGAVLERFFAFKPLCHEPEGVEIVVPPGFDASRFQLTGNVAGDGPYRGYLVHHGWEAGRCELPTWNGNASAARIIAATEVEVK